jgi:hexosaminidase
MKKILLILLVFVSTNLFVFAQNSEINIIPQPRSVNRLKGEFKLNYNTKIAVTNAGARRTATMLNDLLMKNYGFKLEYVSGSEKPKKNVIVFSSGGEVPDWHIFGESYNLIVSPQTVRILGDEEGMFYGLQSLMQMLPVNFKGEAKIPAVEIRDAPRFRYRGMHLDVGRHFFPVEFIKKYLDLMAQYKFNYFHWHLTEDQGWRIEIKKYPRLTEIGSKRKETHEGRYSTVFKGDGVPVEGFYTQEQIKEIVAYAKARYITVIPEIELPGHSSAALAAYPEFGCKENYEYKVQMTWGIFKEVFCPTEATFKFLEDVLTETIALFPDSPYIHIGGDEVLKDHWKESAFVQELKQRENLKDEHEVQSYFIRRIEKFINSKGKKIIGWDEILEGGLAPNATVMSWRGEKGGIAAAKVRHDVIMTPTDFMYFDYGQGDPQYEPINIGGYVPLEKVYSYNPHPKELTDEEKQYILGAQANVWTEYMKTPDKVEYMVFPRMLALAEVVWSPLEKKNYEDFLRRLSAHFQRLDKQNVNYRIPAPEGLQNVLVGEAGKTKIELKSQIPGGKIFYTLDGNEPTENSKLYEKPFELELKPDEKIEVKTIVVNEKGRKSVPYTATILRREKLKAVELSAKANGVQLIFYSTGASYKSVADLDNAPERGEAVSFVKSIALNQFAKMTNDLKSPFGARFDAYIYAPADAIYEFELESKDGAVLTIGDTKLIDLDGIHPKQKKNAAVPLAKGYHKFNLRYFNNGGTDPGVLNLRWGIKNQILNRVSGNDLFVRMTDE